MNACKCACMCVCIRLHACLHLGVSGHHLYAFYNSHNINQLKLIVIIFVTRYIVFAFDIIMDVHGLNGGLTHIPPW